MRRGLRENDVDDNGIYIRISVDTSSFLPWIAVLMDGEEAVQVGKGHFLGQALQDCETRLKLHKLPTTTAEAERQSLRRSLLSHTIQQLRRTV